ncbi:MAG: hypothetical protein HQM09_24850 [Candidatus Riflebacteria bacterium]|nr:hypothetical protein [Candidatus Riflebacteria bacterium]
MCEVFAVDTDKSESPGSPGSSESKVVAAFSYRPPKEEKIKEKTVEEEEADQLQDIQEKEEAFFQALWSLAGFYCSIGRQEKSLALINRILRCSDDRTTHARMILGLGQTSEQLKQWEAAIGYYSAGIELNAENDRETWYFLHNNLGYCLNVLGKFQAGETYLRKAIGIDDGKPNGFKNLGISLEGQGKFMAAAMTYIQATRANAADGRAFQLLTKLVEGHPELHALIPYLPDTIDELRKAIELVRGIREKKVTAPN